jgi:3-phenylpropionate/trans-cinnamate dioxygenase ferredoxin reductase subunit
VVKIDVLIVGGGQAGAQAAISLRQGGFDGSITIVGEEIDPPYERPPLSKDYLAGDKTADRLALRPATFWVERGVALFLGHQVVAVDPAGHTVTTATGEVLAYGTLIWAAGGHPRPLPVPGAELPGVHVIRSRTDVDLLTADLAVATDVAIIGGGYIGLEAAAVLCKAGKTVTVLEAQDRVLARVAAEPISRFYEREHRARGVDVRLNVRIDAIAVERGGVAGVVTDRGTVPAQVVIVGIGLIPAVAALAAAGATTSNGVEVDDHCRTSLPDVFAIGDCAHHVNVFADRAGIRLESVQNAIDQAKTVAGVILGAAQPYHAVPWFWSNQYDLKLQTAGLSAGHDATIVRGDPATRSWSLVYLRRGRVIALDCVNAARDFVQGKALVEHDGGAGLAADPALLADATVPLKSLFVSSS